jgi:putative addiction module killer protein
LEVIPQELKYTDEFADWEERLPGDVRGKVRIRLLRVEKGLFGAGHGVGNGVHELVFKDHPGTRVYYGRSGNSVILLTGGNKRTQTRDIAKAKDMWREINGN